MKPQLLPRLIIQYQIMLKMDRVTVSHTLKHLQRQFSSDIFEGFFRSCHSVAKIEKPLLNAKMPLSGCRQYSSFAVSVLSLVLTVLLSCSSGKIWLTLWEADGGVVGLTVNNIYFSLLQCACRM